MAEVGKKFGVRSAQTPCSYRCGCKEASKQTSICGLPVQFLPTNKSRTLPENSFLHLLQVVVFLSQFIPGIGMWFAYKAGVYPVCGVRGDVWRG